MDFSTFASKASTVKDAAFYPAAETALILATVVVVCQAGFKATTRFRVSPLVQCCYALLFALSFVQCTDWANAHFPLSAGLFSLLTLHPSGYYPFQLANLLGMYRSLNGDIGGDIWHQVLYVSMHAFLLVANLDTFGQGILNDMQRLVAYTQERRLVSLRNTRDIELDDLDELPERMRMGSVANEFKYDVNESAFVVRAIVRYAWRAMLPIYIVEAILGIAVVATSLLNTRILHFLDMPAAYTWHGGYSILFLGLFADILVKQFGRIKVYLEGESDRVIQALNLELFRLPLTNAGLRKERTISEARSAATEIRYCIGDLQPVIGKLAGIISVIVAIYSYIGWFVLVPALVEVTMISIEWLMKRYLGHEFDWRPVSTSHTFSANVEEIFRNIKAIKMFGWERVYADPELQKHWQSEENVGGILPWYAPIVRLSWKLFSYVSMVTTELSVYLAVHLYTATSAGSTHAISSADMFQLDMLIRDLNKIYESVKWRYGSFTALIYQTYTLEKALKGDFVSSLPRYPLGSVEGEKELDSPKPSVTLEDCDFSLVTDEAVLEDISFNAQDGELVAVVGKTGTGKSSLLLSICGEVEETKGTGAVFGTIAFMEQAPVIINDTIRENILFGRKYDKEHYNQVIEACALTEDINAWKKGDRTVIGDRGIKISGGQRARLALARTIYSKADIYVLDDPLSAVDAHVKRHILDNVIMDSGLLGGKLRILTVSSEKLLPYFNQVIRLDQGKAAVTKQVPQIYQPLTTAISDVKDSVNNASNTGLTDATEITENDQQMTVTEYEDNIEPDYDFKFDNLFGSKGVSRPEIRQWGKWSNIKYVVKVFGVSSFATVFLVGYINPVLGYIMDEYKLDILSSNTSGRKAENAVGVLNYLRISMLNEIIENTFEMIRLHLSDTFRSSQLQTKISSMFVNSLIHAPLSFYDSTTSTDLSSIYDSISRNMSNGIPDFLMWNLSSVLEITLSIYRITRNAPLLLLAIPLAIWYDSKRESLFGPIKESLRRIQGNASIKIRKLDNIIFGGKRLIRLLNVESYFTNLYTGMRNAHTRILYTEDAIRALSKTVDHAVYGSCNSLVKVAMIVQNYFFGHSISSSGFITFANLYQKIVNDMTVVLEIPRKFHSINKGIDILRHYTGMERDGGPDEDTVEPPSNWLSSGKIELRNFSMKYHEDLEYVLKNISLTINPGERIGIVGRTGAGKTSLCRAIFRLANKKTCEGSILIDGYDISTIRISDLRPKLGTIPQESTMFTGSFKQNLDPLMEYTIEDMWAALIKCNMVELVEPKRDRTRDRSIGSYSDYYESIKRDIADWDEEWQRSSWMKRIFLWMYVAKPKLPSGGNPKEIYGLGKSIGDYNRFSDGQRQLFSLCRLLMRKRKIIVLDEATADVDLETDKEMQKLFRSEFRDSTVLTIAHRLETIMNSDKIIVMDKGRVVEFGPPKDLIDQGGYFSELVKANEF